MPKKTRETQVLAGERTYIILEEMNYARHANLQEAITLAEKQQSKEPARTFIVLQLVATIEPQISSKVTRHL